MTTVQLPRLAQRSERLIGSIIDASTGLLAEQEHDIVRFAMGAPGEDLIPVADLNESFARSVTGRFDYGESEGEPALREQILRLAEEAGAPTSDDRLLITTGGMQGLDLAFKMCVDPGDLVIIEAPTYTNGYATALSYGADVVAAPTDADGLVVEALPEIVRRAGRAPRLIYTIPNFQNPRGVTLSRARRERLIELAEEWGSIILEDDPYGALRFEGEQVPGLAEIAPRHPLVFQVRTFSKTIAPGLRTGWIDVDPSIRRIAVNAKQAMDTCTNMPAQLAVADYLERGKFGEHVDHLLPIYRERKVAMQRALSTYLGDHVQSTDPEGGFFLWLTLQGDYSAIDTEQMFSAALSDGVAYIPGPAFTADGSMRNALRVCFATSTPERIDEGVRRLAGTLQHAAADMGARA